MYSHQSNNRGPVHVSKGMVTLLFFVVAMVIVLVRMTEDGRPARSGQGASATSPPGSGHSTEADAQASNPIERQLRPSVGVQSIEGIGVVLLIDTSGSMKDNVADATGRQSRKIEIARRCALNMLRQCDAFGKANPDRVVRVGVSEFSHRDTRDSCRVVIPVGPLDIQAASHSVQTMYPEGDTPIGDAIISAKRSLDATGLTHLHILVVTDGENNRGYDPADVVNAVSLLPADNRASVYFVAFDIAANRFAKVREAGGLVLAAGNEKELQQNLDYVLTGKILAEQPIVPGKSK